jgi:hypothetical protein
MQDSPSFIVSDSKVSTVLEEEESKVGEMHLDNEHEDGLSFRIL